MRAAFRSVSVVLVVSAAVAQARGVWAPQAFDWQAASPESQAVSGRALEDLKSRLARNTKALLVVRNDRLIFEWYAPDHSATAKHYTASMAKAIVEGAGSGLRPAQPCHSRSRVGSARNHPARRARQR